jgi:Rod binding domain-containing protein
MSNELKTIPTVTVPLSGYSSGAEAARSSKDKNLDKALEGFESFFLFTMLKELDKTTHFTKKKGCTEQTYMTVAYEKLGDYLAKKGVGIKEAMQRYLDRGVAKVSNAKGDNRVK